MLKGSNVTSTRGGSTLKVYAKRTKKRVGGGWGVESSK